MPLHWEYKTVRFEIALLRLQTYFIEMFCKGKIRLIVKKCLSVLLTVVKITLILLISILLTYSVLFSISGTVVIVKGYRLINEHLQKVTVLKDTNPVQTQYMENYREILAGENSPDTLVQKYVPFDSISGYLKMSVLAAEDDGFYLHPGIDIESIAEAMKHNRTHGTIKRGGSTITQQLAKNLFLSKERTFDRKIYELGYALLMEHYLGKDRIFELYLNYAQWGKNIFGCEAASQYYYKKSCSKLTLNEAASLAAVLAMPSKLSPLNYKSVFLGKRIFVIANNLYLHKNINDSEYFALTGTSHPSKDSLALELKPVGNPDSSAIKHLKLQNYDKVRF